MDKNYRALELDKILEMVAAEASCPDGAELARAIQPVYTAAEARRLLEETDAAFVLMAKFGGPSFYGLRNVTNALRRAQAGGGLGLPALLAVGLLAVWRFAAARQERLLFAWFSLVYGVLFTVLGIFLLVQPDTVLTVLPAVFGVFVLLDSLGRPALAQGILTAAGAVLAGALAGVGAVAAVEYGNVTLLLTAVWLLWGLVRPRARRRAGERR